MSGGMSGTATERTFRMRQTMSPLCQKRTIERVIRLIHQREGIARTPKSHRSLELALTRRHRCSKTCGPSYHRTL